MGVDYNPGQIHTVKTISYAPQDSIIKTRNTTGMNTRNVQNRKLSTSGLTNHAE